MVYPISKTEFTQVFKFDCKDCGEEQDLPVAVTNLDDVLEMVCDDCGAIHFIKENR